MSEALERLLFQGFIYEKKLTVLESYFQFAADPRTFPDSISGVKICVFVEEYQKYRAIVRASNAGKTGQFWMMYLDLMQAQSMAHTSVQENKISMLIAAWKTFIPMYFA